MLLAAKSVILLQIVMVSLGIHLVKNHKSLVSITNESQLKKTRIHAWAFV